MFLFRRKHNLDEIEEEVQKLRRQALSDKGDEVAILKATNEKVYKALVKLGITITERKTANA